MAQSRRRERELARRRFERRRMAEVQRREQRHRRNTQLGAIAGVAAVILAVVLIAVFVVGGGKPQASLKPKSSTSPSPTTSSSTVPAGAKCATVNPDPPAQGEPEVPQVKGKPPTKLVTNDITVGTGTEAKKGDSVTVKYVGVACSTGKAFDASYTDGAKNQEFTFTLGQGQVIPGWDQGVAGMKVGGVRQLVIPPALAYGATGSPPAIKGNETLNFVITLDKVTSK